MRPSYLTDAQIRRQERRLHGAIANFFYKVPRFTLEQLSDNTFGRVTGRATVFEKRTLTAPLSGRPCLYYRASVTDSLSELVFEECAFPFVLEEGQRSAVVVPIFSRVWSAFDLTSRSSDASDITRAEHALLVRRGGHQLTMRRLIYREAIIEPGATVTICGAGIHEPDPEGRLGETDYRTGTAMRLRFEGSPKLALLVTDVPGEHTHA